MTHYEPPAPDSVRAELLDCIQANLAVLADHHHGPGTHLRLGATLRLRWRPGPGGLPTVDPELGAHLADAERLAGLRTTARTGLLPWHELLLRLRERGGVHYVVADSYGMPWLPYHRQAHMDHSFLLTPVTDGWQITDAYRNDTPWGSATPGRWVLTEEQLADIEKAELVDLEPVALPAAPLAEVAEDRVEEYLDAYATCPDRALALERLTVETWLLARARRLHAAYLAESGQLLHAYVDEHLARWDKLVEQTYLASRRVARGRAEPTGVVARLAEAIAADRQAFAGTHSGSPEQAAASRDTASDELRRTVAATVGSVLGVPDTRLLDGAGFDTFPGYSSFRLVEIIERLESERGVEFDADDLIPENLRSVDDLCRIAR